MNNLLNILRESTLATQISTTNDRFAIWNGSIMKIKLLTSEDETKAILYVFEARGVRPYTYKTSLIESINYKDDMITVKTRNSVYVFVIKESLKLEPFESKFDSYIEEYDSL